MRTDADVKTRSSAVRTVPPALAIEPSPPAYVNEAALARNFQSAVEPHLERYRDLRVRRRAQLAPLALLIPVALALSAYFATS